VGQEESSSVTGNPELDYASGQPNLYKMMRLKQKLFAEHGLEQGYSHFQGKVNCIANRRLARVPLSGERTFAATHGALFSETAVAGEPFMHLPPHVTGDGNHRPLHGITRSQYLACISNAQIRGRSAAIVSAGSLLLDIQDDERGTLDDELEWDPAIFRAEPDHVWLIPPRDADSALIIDEAFTLLGAHTDFFGHWMCEYLPKYVASLLSGKLSPAIPVLIDAHMPISHRQSLELLFGPNVQVIEVQAFSEVRVAKLWCAPSLMYMPLHEKRNERFSWDAVSASPERFAPVIRDMIARADRALVYESPFSKRVFLARKGFRHRKLINFEAIQNLAKERGFQIVYPEDLPFAKQVSLVRNARTIIAPEGSAIFLAFFASPGTDLLILSHPFTDVLADYNGILGLHGVNIRVITGPMKRMNEQTPHDSDYEIELADFEYSLDQQC